MKVALASAAPAVDVEWTQAEHDKFGAISQNPKKTAHWDIAFPVGDTFNVHWQYGIDWTGVTMVRSRMFTESELGIVLRFNYTDRRDEFNVVSGANTAIANLTSGDLATTAPASTSPQQLFGTNKNDIPNRQWFVAVNGHKEDKGYSPHS